MDLMHALRTRRSIRKFEDKPVSEAMIRQVLEAAMAAPSAGNAQPWQFVVITDPAKLAEAAAIHPYAAMAAQAPVGILVCGDLSLEKYAGYWVQDCSAAMQNLLLAAHGLGLGAVWTGIYPIEERGTGFAKLVGLPNTVIPLGFAPLGWPAQPSGEVSRFREDRIHHNTY
ncbi:MAG: nitroreductase family protein [Pseudomonadota bacterium]